MSVALQTVMPGRTYLVTSIRCCTRTRKPVPNQKNAGNLTALWHSPEEGTERSKRLRQDLGGGVGVFRKTFGLGLPLPRFQARKKPNLLRECEKASLIFSAV